MMPVRSQLVSFGRIAQMCLALCSLCARGEFCLVNGGVTNRFTYAATADSSNNHENIRAVYDTSLFSPVTRYSPDPSSVSYQNFLGAYPAGQGPWMLFNDPTTTSAMTYGNKYYNTWRGNCGVVFRPTLAAGQGARLTGIIFWSAYDQVTRTPTVFSIEGTCDADPYASRVNWIPICLKPTGLAALGIKQQGPYIPLGGSRPYTAFRILFPTTQSAAFDRIQGAGNDAMQLAEITLFAVQEAAQ